MSLSHWLWLYTGAILCNVMSQMTHGRHCGPMNDMVGTIEISGQLPCSGVQSQWQDMWASCKSPLTTDLQLLNDQIFWSSYFSWLEFPHCIRLQRSQKPSQAFSRSLTSKQPQAAIRNWLLRLGTPRGHQLPPSTRELLQELGTEAPWNWLNYSDLKQRPKPI